MRFSYLGWIILGIVTVCLLVSAEETPEPLLSTRITLSQNTPERIGLHWSDGDVHVAKDPVLLFVSGPVSSATYTVKHFSWRSVSPDGKERGKGDETTFPRGEKKWTMPRVNLREIGTLADIRLAVFTLDLHAAVASNEPQETLEFPSGEIEILFSTIDDEPFENLPTAIDEITRKLVLNYPPLRRVQRERKDMELPPYASVPAIKFHHREPGIMRVPGESLFPVLGKKQGEELLVQNLAVFQDRKAIPFLVLDAKQDVKTQGEVQGTDTIYYYQPKSQSPYSPDSVTWIASVPDFHRDLSSFPTISAATEPVIMEQRIHLEEDHHFIEEGDKNEKQSQFWMWHDFVQGGTQTISFPLSAGQLPQSASAHFRFCSSQSYINLATDSLYVDLNSTRVRGVLKRSPEGDYLSDLEIAAGLLKPGTNTLMVNIRLEKQYSPSEMGVYLDSIDLHVPTHLIPSKNPYWLNSKGTRITLPANHGGAWLIHENGSVDNPVFYTRAGSATIEFPTPAQERKLYLFPNVSLDALPNQHLIPMGSQEPISTPLIQHSLIQDRSGADIILVAPHDWLPILEPFANDLRENHYRVRQAVIEDIYNLFGDGRTSPYPLRDFLQYAYRQWQSPHPSYVFLVGDANWDYWERYNLGVHNYIPAIREQEKYPVENWFVRIDDPSDRLPDSIIARWPIQSATGLQIVVDKTLRYKNNPPLGSWWNRAFVLTDDTFERYSQELLDTWIPPAMRTIQRHIADYSLVDNIYLPERLRIQTRAKTSPDATREIIQILSQGAFLWDYFGHGAPNVLGNERMFFGGGSKYSDVHKLTNQTKLPMLWAYTCQTAEFDYPREKWNISIGEDMLTYPDGGMIALVGATGRGYPTDHIVLARGMHQAAFRDRFSTLGQIFFAATLYGQSQMPFFEPLNQFVILGDPTLLFPKFQNIEGTAKREKEGISYQWKPDSSQEKSSLYSIWGETNREIVADPKPHAIKENPGEIEGIFTHSPLSDIRKIGIDRIGKDAKRIVVTHGAISIAGEVQAASLIEPTTGCLPDLSWVSGSIQVLPQVPRSGETIYLKALLRNTGHATATRIAVQGYDVPTESGLILMNAKVGKNGYAVERLDPGQEIPVQVRWDPTDNAGSHRVRITVDPDKRIPEMDEENNSLTTEVHILRKADLIVDASKVEIRPIEGGKRLQVYFEIRNQGESPAEKIVIELTRKDRGSQKPESIRFPQTYDVKPGEFRAFGGIKMPGEIESLKILIDPDEIVDEESHENNVYTYPQ